MTKKTEKNAHQSTLPRSSTAERTANLLNLCRPKHVQDQSRLKFMYLLLNSKDSRTAQLFNGTSLCFKYCACLIAMVINAVIALG